MTAKRRLENDSWETIGTLAALTSLTEVLVVQSTSVDVRVFTRDASGKRPDDPIVSGPGGTVRLSSIGLDIPVADIYDGTLLESEAVGGEAS